MHVFVHYYSVHLESCFVRLEARNLISSARNTILCVLIIIPCARNLISCAWLIIPFARSNREWVVGCSTLCCISQRDDPVIFSQLAG